MWVCGRVRQRYTTTRDEAVVELSWELHTCEGGDMDATPDIGSKLGCMACKMTDIAFRTRIG